MEHKKLNYNCYKQLAYKVALVQVGSLLLNGDRIEYNQYPAQAVFFPHGMGSGVQSTMKTKQKEHHHQDIQKV